MAKLLKLPNAQTVLSAVFEFNFNDTMVNTAGVEKAFSVVETNSFDIVTPPVGAVVTGGTIHNVTPYVGPTASSLDLGDSDDPDRYTATIHDLKSATAQTVLSPAGAGAKSYSGSQAIRMELINTVAAATAGKAVITINMVVPGRATENLKTT